MTLADLKAELLKNPDVSGEYIALLEARVADLEAETELQKRHISALQAAITTRKTSLKKAEARVAELEADPRMALGYSDLANAADILDRAAPMWEVIALCQRWCFADIAGRLRRVALGLRAALAAEGKGEGGDHV